MSSRHYATLRAIFEDPVRSSIDWRDIEALFRFLEAEITEGRGSRVRVVLNGRKAVFHRPHPEKETDRGAVKSVREYLFNAGVEP